LLNLFGKNQTEIISEVLNEIGLTDSESKIYIFLAKSGVNLSATNIAQGLKMQKMSVYRNLNRMKNEGLVRSIIGFPMQYRVEPLRNIIDLFVTSKKKEIECLEKHKEKILTYWESTAAKECSFSPESFLILEGLERINSKISQLIQGAEKELLAITSSEGLIRADFFGNIERIVKQNIQSRILVNLSKGKPELIKRTLNQKYIDFKKTNCVFRFIELQLNPAPRFVIIDADQALFFTRHTNDLGSIANREDTAICTNCKNLVNVFADFHRRLWRESISMKELDTNAKKHAVKACE
jgi:sugar-specific transcriptional regulator TrmB